MGKKLNSALYDSLSYFHLFQSLCITPVNKEGSHNFLHHSCSPQVPNALIAKINWQLKKLNDINVDFVFLENHFIPVLIKYLFRFLGEIFDEWRYDVLVMQVSTAGWNDETINAWNWSTDWTEWFRVRIWWHFRLFSTHRYSARTCIL